MLDDAPGFADYESGSNDAVHGAPLADMDRIKSDPTLSKDERPERAALLRDRLLQLGAEGP